jgi:hypothetical protein
MPLTTYSTPEQAPNAPNYARMVGTEKFIKPFKIHYNPFYK